MNIERQRERNRIWMKEARRKERERRKRLVPRAMQLVLEGKCPFCEMILNDPWHNQHPCFSYQLHIIAMNIHAENASSPQMVHTEHNGETPLS